jgi:glycerol-3-phosphate acyltransferase PlsY
MLMGLLAIAVAYLIGAIPTAYLVTRWRTGEDIRTLGGGNVGAANVYREVGHYWGVGVGVFDALKGALAVMLAFLMLYGTSQMEFGAPNIWVFGAAVAVVAGHIWPVFLRFRGGNGLAPTIGVVFVLMPGEALMALAVGLVLLVLSNNPILAANLSLLLAVPAMAALYGKSWMFFALIGILILMLVLNFLPTLKKALGNRNRHELVDDLLRIDRPEKTKKKKKKQSGK